MKAAASLAPTFGGGGGGGGGAKLNPTPPAAPAPGRKKGLMLSAEERRAMKEAASSAPVFEGGFGGGGGEGQKGSESGAPASLAARNALRFSSSAPKKSFLGSAPSPAPSPAPPDDPDDDDEHRSLSSAVALVGTCEKMCPRSEVVQRDRETDVKLLERPSSAVFPKGWTIEDTCVKRFRRSAAAYKLNIPELVRPPRVLERTTSYMEEYVMSRDLQGEDDRVNRSLTPR